MAAIWHTAVIYSIIEESRRRGMNPQDYPSDMLRRLPEQTIQGIDEILPGNKKPPT